MISTFWKGIAGMVLAAVAVPAGGCQSGRQEGDAREVVVFAAASLRDVMQELGSRFEEENGVRVLFNFAGSNVLAQQITATPKADLYVSANERWMDAVEEAGRVVAGTRRVLVSNRLIVIAAAHSAWAVADPCALADLDFKYLALGDPDAVPAGGYARTWLDAQRCGGVSLWQAVEARVAPAPDARAALGLVLADPDLIGIVYKTDWLAFSERTRMLYEVPAAAGPAIRYVVARIDGGPNPEDARRFLDFLTAPEARRTFEHFGFAPTVPEG